MSCMLEAAGFHVSTGALEAPAGSSLLWAWVGDGFLRCQLKFFLAVNLEVSILSVEGRSLEASEHGMHFRDIVMCDQDLEAR